MTNTCPKSPEWKDQLLDAALTGIASAALEEHLSNCPACTAELAALRTRRAQMDALLPLVAQSAEPSPDFRARVLTAAQAADETKRSPSHFWQLAGAAAAIVVVLAVGLTLYRRASVIPQNELAVAQQLANWRAPSDVLLATPVPEAVNAIPTLGDSYLRLPLAPPENAPKDTHRNN